MSGRRSYQVVAAVIRRQDTVLLVCQQGPADAEPYWSLPGGVVEVGELLTEALAREVWEETGLPLLTLGPLLYVCQSDTPADATQPGQETLAHVFAATVPPGEPAHADPDELISSAAFVPLAEAITRLAAKGWRPMCEPIVAYLRGEAAPGMIWCYRRQADGSEALIARG
ncbi:MAG: NUDIX hydrolase [Chloroflexota bacterium]|nr:NUDIX hydrolase [Chloroflexota bacterium]